MRFHLNIRMFKQVSSTCYATCMINFTRLTHSSHAMFKSWEEPGCEASSAHTNLKASHVFDFTATSKFYVPLYSHINSKYYYQHRRLAGLTCLMRCIYTEERGRECSIGARVWKILPWIQKRFSHAHFSPLKMVCFHTGRYSFCKEGACAKSTQWGCWRGFQRGGEWHFGVEGCGGTQRLCELHRRTGGCVRHSFSTVELLTL